MSRIANIVMLVCSLPSFIASGCASSRAQVSPWWHDSYRVETEISPQTDGTYNLAHKIFKGGSLWCSPSTDKVPDNYRRCTIPFGPGSGIGGDRPIYGQLSFETVRDEDNVRITVWIEVFNDKRDVVLSSKQTTILNAAVTKEQSNHTSEDIRRPADGPPKSSR